MSGRTSASAVIAALAVALLRAHVQWAHSERQAFLAGVRYGRARRTCQSCAERAAR